MQNKGLAAILLVASTLCLYSVPIFAQAAQGANAGQNAATDTDIKLLREDIRSERKRIVAANLPLTATEATRFWPIYDQYSAEFSRIGDANVALIKEYAQS